jgi:hypothetical protein
MLDEPARRLCSCQGAGSCCALVCLPRRPGGGGRCPCSQVGGLADVSGADRQARGLRGELYAGVGVALNYRARAHALAWRSVTSWRDVPAAEAWPPSSELGQTAPRVIVLVVSPRGLLLVPSRSFTSGLLVVPRDPSRPAVQARSHSGVSTCSRGRGSLVGIVVACTQSRMSGNRAVHVGRLRAGAPNCRPAAPITLSPRAWVTCGEAGFLCCVPTSVEFKCEAVPLSRAPPRGRGASLAAAPVFQSSGLPSNWFTRDRSCFRMQNAMTARGPPPL